MAKKVQIYSTPTCHYCKMAKEFFNDHHIAYEDFNVGLDATRRQEMIDKSGQMGVPVIVIADEEGEESIIVGFDKPTISGFLGL